MATAQDTASKETDRLNAEIAKLRQELADVTSRLKDGVAPSARDAAMAAGRAAAERVGEIRDRAIDYGEATVTSAKDQVRAHPLTAVGLAFSLGALVAILLRR
ncbi:MAG: hypothetical protein ACFCVH_19440 [Alphaproteobacteria bacterium]